MKKFYKTLLSLWLLIFFVACAHDHEEKKYSCTIGGDGMAPTTTYQATSCAALPAEGVKIQVLNLTVPTGETFGLRFYTNPAEDILNNAGGIQIEFTDTNVSAGFANGATPTSRNKGAATSFCIEVHDITKEKHVQVFPGESCRGTTLIDLDDSTASALSNRAVAYKRTNSSVTIGSIRIKKDAHGHNH